MMENDGRRNGSGLMGWLGRRTWAVPAVVVGFVGVAGVVPAWGQAVGSADASKDEVEPLSARVIEVSGQVRQAPVGVSAAEAGWSPVRVDDRLKAGTQIKTGFRSSVVLEFGPDTVVQVRKATLASVEEFYRTATEKHVLIGLGYGTVRGGTTEAELRTDVVVDSNVATLAKRGTEGWEFWVEPSTGRFRISLARSGLVEALAKASGTRRLVRPNQYVTERSMKTLWINQTLFDRKVSFYDRSAISASEAKFAAEHAGGAAVVSPDSAQSDQLVRRVNPSFVSQQIAERGGRGVQPTMLTPAELFRLRPEGDFGIAPTLGNALGGFGNGSSGKVWIKHGRRSSVRRGRR